MPNARREFDAAIDLMLEAAEPGPDRPPGVRTAVWTRWWMPSTATTWPDWAPRPAWTEDKFEKAPLEDILQMTFPVDPKLKDKVREQVAATVSQLPLSVNDTVLGYINYFSNRGHKTMIAATAALGPLPAHDPAHPGRRRRTAGIDPPGAGRIRLHSARGFAQGGRRHVAVPDVARQGVRPDADPIHGRSHGSRKRPRAPPPTTCTTSTTNSATGTWRSRLTIAAPSRWRRPWSAPATRISGNCAPAACCPPRPPTTCRSFWP